MVVLRCLVCARLDLSAARNLAHPETKMPAPMRRRPLRIDRSDRLQVGRGGLAAAAVGLDVESQLLPLGQAAHAGALDGGDVNEHIRAALVLHDEAETLLGVEKLDGTLSHDGPPLKTHHASFGPREPFGRSKS